MKNLKLNFALIAFFALASFSFTLASPNLGGTESGDSLPAATTASISINKAMFCTAIAEREPIGIATTFTKDVGRVYLYSQIKLPKGSHATIQHVWKLEGKTICTVDLKVRGPRWRTRSYKTITPKMAGNWTVDVMTGGKLLESFDFQIQ